MDETQRRALKQKLKAKIRERRQGGNATKVANDARKAAQDMVLSIEDPALFEVAQNALRTKDASAVRRMAAASVDDDDEAPPSINPVYKAPKDDPSSSEEEEAPPLPFV